VHGELGSRLAALEERVGRLEQRQVRETAVPPFEDGSVLFAETRLGAVVWQEERPVAALLAGGWADAAGALGALGHPVRLEIVRRLLAGAHTTHELAEIPDLGTSGQLYHHLRELQAAGLVTQRRRNDYAVPADRVIPCLVLVAAAQTCAHVGEIAS
jgi:DNA-binding transcriptional ArsR family regulator